MVKIVNRQMPVPRELPQQIPTPWAKARMQSLRVGANFWCKSPGVCGGMVMAKIDSCITRGSSLQNFMKIWRDSLPLKLNQRPPPPVMSNFHVILQGDLILNISQSIEGIFNIYHKSKDMADFLN